ncbi:hypothetical protein M758_UG110100 [Ceratodon purpureus]|nr:hypothetical protein M758_UG110100 [Ceratodon purpureus]
MRECWFRDQRVSRILLGLVGFVSALLFCEGERGEVAWSPDAVECDYGGGQEELSECEAEGAGGRGEAGGYGG